MTPTAKLRFVERDLFVGLHDVKVIRVLQQWWIDNSTDVHWIAGTPGEWRDVPLENEND